MTILFKAYYKTPIGIIEISAKENEIISLYFSDSTIIKTQKQAAIIDQFNDEMDAYFNGNLTKFSIPFNFSGTDFQCSVWKELLNIPYGETISYGELSKKIKNPAAVRAVGNANGSNPISIIVPCHRVIGSNGKLIGYSGGLWRKKWLLEHEKKVKYGIISLF